MKGVSKMDIDKKKLLKKIKKKLLRVTGIRLINDAVFMGVVYATTGNVVNSLTTLGTMKVASTIIYTLYDEIDLSPMKKALVWELIVSCLSILVNGIIAGQLEAALRITLLMKVCIPINWIWNKYMDKEGRSE